jgi:hypothetical protein
LPAQRAIVWAGERKPLAKSGRLTTSTRRLSVCPEMIFRLRKLFGNKGANFDCLTGRKTSLFSNFFGDLDYNNSWL